MSDPDKQPAVTRAEFRAMAIKFGKELSPKMRLRRISYKTTREVLQKIKRNWQYNLYQRRYGPRAAITKRFLSIFFAPPRVSAFILGWLKGAPVERHLRLGTVVAGTYGLAGWLVENKPITFCDPTDPRRVSLKRQHFTQKDIDSFVSYMAREPSLLLAMEVVQAGSIAYFHRLRWQSERQQIFRWSYFRREKMFNELFLGTGMSPIFSAYQVFIFPFIYMHARQRGGEDAAITSADIEAGIKSAVKAKVFHATAQAPHLGKGFQVICPGNDYVVGVLRGTLPQAHAYVQEKLRSGDPAFTWAYNQLKESMLEDNPFLQPEGWEPRCPVDHHKPSSPSWGKRALSQARRALDYIR